MVGGGAGSGGVGWGRQGGLLGWGLEAWGLDEWECGWGEGLERCADRLRTTPRLSCCRYHSKEVSRRDPKP